MTTAQRTSMPAAATDPDAPGARTDGAVSAYASELSVAVRIAERAGELQMDRYERVERVSYKSARDIVTEVDQASERLIIDAILGAYPEDGILAEESGEHRGSGGIEIAAATGRTWIVDPLDGTINYANGIPVFCVSIGLAVDGRAVAGVVFDPTRDERFTATLDGPARLNGHVVATSTKERLSDFVISMALSGRAVSSRMRAVRKEIRIARSMGSSALGLAYVGCGRFDAFVQTAGLSAWDVAAAGLIAARGGATVTDASGGPWFDLGRDTRKVGVLAAPPAHHPRLLELTRQSVPPAVRPGA